MSSDESEAPGEANMWHWLFELAYVPRQKGLQVGGRLEQDVRGADVSNMHVCSNVGTSCLWRLLKSLLGILCCPVTL